jgi:hypothetical protein
MHMRARSAGLESGVYTLVAHSSGTVVKAEVVATAGERRGRAGQAGRKSDEVDKHDGFWIRNDIGSEKKSSSKKCAMNVEDVKSLKLYQKGVYAQKIPERMKVCLYQKSKSVPQKAKDVRQLISIRTGRGVQLYHHQRYCNS